MRRKKSECVNRTKPNLRVAAGELARTLSRLLT